MILSIKKTNDTVFPLHTPHTLYFKIINYCYFEIYSETLNFYFSMITLKNYMKVLNFLC